MTYTLVDTVSVNVSPTRRRYLEALGTAGFAGTVSGCTDDALIDAAAVPLRVGSKSFTEQELLGYLAYHRLRELDGIRLIDRIGRGDSLSLWEETRRGETDLYWEYTGTAWIRLPPRRDDRVTDPQELYERVEMDARPQGVRVSVPAPFSNEYVLVADREWSEETGIATIGAFATHVADGHVGVNVAVNEAFYNRRDGWSGLLEQYGVSSSQRRAFEREAFTVTSIGLTYELLDSGEAVVANGFATDPQLDRDAFVELTDDADYFLPYNPAPIAHAPTIEEHPEVFDALAPVASALDKPTIRDLNREALIRDRSTSAVAESFLHEKVY